MSNQREAFEDLVNASEVLGRDEDGEYRDIETSVCWKYWKAAIASMEKQLLERDAVIEQMRKTYAEAIEDISEWGNYADDYFKEKWHFQEDIKRHQDFLASIPLSEPLAKHDAAVAAKALEDMIAEFACFNKPDFAWLCKGIRDYAEELRRKV